MTAKSRTILRLIAEGNSCEQILAKRPQYQYPDIFAAAAEALGPPALAETFPLLERSGSSVDGKADYQDRLAEIRKQHPRAYLYWTAQEEEKLRSLYQSGMKISALAEVFERQSGAIRNRLTKLGCLESGKMEQ